MSQLAIAVPLPHRQSKNAVRRILAGNAVSVLGDGLLLPFTAVYFVRVFGFSMAGAGLVLATMTGASVVLTAPAGVLLDRLGTRRATMLATLAQAAGCVALGFASTLLAAVAAAVLYGAGRAVARPGVDAIVGELTAAADRTAAFAGLNFATNVGFGAGAALGGLIAGLGSDSLRWLFLLNAASFVAFALVLQSAPDVAADARSTAAAGYRAVLRDRAFVVLAAVAFLAAVGLVQIDVGFSLFTVSVVHLPIGIVGLAGLANTVAVVALQHVVVRRTAGLRRTRLLAAGAAGLGLCWTLVGVAAVLPGRILPIAALVTALAVMGAAETLLMPIVFALANDLAPAELRGRYNGALWAAIGGAFAVGPIAGGALIGAHLAGLWVAGLLALAAIAVLLAEQLRHLVGPRLDLAA